MRVISYNILDGGGNRVSDLADVIASQRPDVVCLVEADDLGAVEQIARRMNMDFIHAPGNKKASALLSRFPIQHTINHAPLHPALTKSLLEAVVIDPAGRELTLGVLHLHAHAMESDEVIREREIEEVLGMFAPHRAQARPHLLVGDFNSNAPAQQIDMDAVKPSTRREWHENGDTIPRRVIQRILEAGYRDSLHAVHPHLAEQTGTFSTEHPGQRVDFIFTFGLDTNCLRDAWIHKDTPAALASDHFPIGLELELKPIER